MDIRNVFEQIREQIEQNATENEMIFTLISIGTLLIPIDEYFL